MSPIISGQQCDDSKRCDEQREQERGEAEREIEIHGYIYMERDIWKERQRKK